MKYIISLLFVLGNIATAFAQSPNNMSYQAVIRDASDALITTTIGMQISILQGSSSGTIVYSETHTPTPNDNGLISIEIGNGSVVSGAITTIDWSAGPYFLKVETDPLGGVLYTIIGINEILSVPYARHAKTAESVAGLSTTGVTEGTNLYYTEGRVSANTAVAANTAKTGLTAPQITILNNTSGTNSGDQDISGIATNTAAISNLSTTGVTEGTNLYYTEGRVSANTAVAANTAKTGLSAPQITILTNTSGTNSGDQDISGIATNTTAINLKANIASPTFTGTVTTPALNIPTGAGTGKVLTSDGTGNATWQTKSSAVTYFNNNTTETTITGNNVPAKAMATYSSEELSDFTHDQGKLTYTGSTTKKFIINTSISMFNWEFSDERAAAYIFLNGAKVVKTGKNLSTAKWGEGANSSIIGVIQMSTNDYIEIYVENNESPYDRNLVVTDLYCLITEF